jgi:predicted HAD superfamily hydrolase
LDLAITFYLVASATKDQDRSNRAIANAEKAFAIAASSLDCNLKAEQNVEIEKKLLLLNAVRSGCPPNVSSSLTDRANAS